MNPVGWKGGSLPFSSQHKVNPNWNLLEDKKKQSCAVPGFKKRLWNLPAILLLKKLDGETDFRRKRRQRNSTQCFRWMSRPDMSIDALHTLLNGYARTDPGKKKGLFTETLYLLPEEGSNPYIQSQNLTYYHYTIGHQKLRKIRKVWPFSDQWM